MTLWFVGMLVCTLMIFLVTPFPRLAREARTKWECAFMLFAGVWVSAILAAILVAMLFVTAVVVMS